MLAVPAISCMNRAGSQILKVYFPKHLICTRIGVCVPVIWFWIGCAQSWNGIGLGVPKRLSIISFRLMKYTACFFAVAPPKVNLCHISLNTAPNCPAKKDGEEEASNVYAPSSAVASITLPFSIMIAHCPGATTTKLLLVITPVSVVFSTIKTSFVIFSQEITSFH